VIRYRYVEDLTPPAPYVQVRLQNPVTGAEIGAVPAQIDTAADRSLIPESVVQQLSLPQVSAITLGGVGGIQQIMPTYPVNLAIHDLPYRTIEVVASPGESWVLLGRDVLNRYRLVLDGPQLALEID
jgi:gag-polyprotein putative aspartyl protease